MQSDSQDQKPYFARHVFCCGNERPAGHPRGCCKERGGVELRNYMKARVKELDVADTRINMAGCLDRCELGAVMVIYPEGIWYTYSSRADIDEIVETHLKGSKIVERLRLANDQTELRDDQKPCAAASSCGPGS